MTENASQEWSTVITNDGQALLVICVSHQGTGHVYEYDENNESIREWNSFDEWREEVVGK